jgi:uncharacterized membrane protein
VDACANSLTPTLSAFAATFLASLVEVVEAFTIVLAVGVTRGWAHGSRPAQTEGSRR